MDSGTSEDYLTRRYRIALVAMLGGWALALFVYGGSYIYAKMVVRAARNRAQAIYANPKGVSPATLPEIEGMALLDIVETKRQRRRYLVSSGKMSPEEEKHLIKVEPSYSELVRQFLRVNSTKDTETGAFVGEVGNLKDGNWAWLIPTESAEAAEKWADQPGTDWWFIDPATGEVPYPSLAGVEEDMRLPMLGVGRTTVAPKPRVWLFAGPLLCADAVSRRQEARCAIFSSRSMSWRLRKPLRGFKAEFGTVASRLNYPVA